MATTDDLKAQLAKLKGASFKLSDEKKEAAALAREIVAEQERLDEEGQEAIQQIAFLREAEARAALPENLKSTTIVCSVVDWPTHKRTMAGGDIESGRGVMVVRSLDGAAAAKYLRVRGKFQNDGASLYDMSFEAMSSVLMKATLYPSLDVLQVLLTTEEPLCRAAYQSVMHNSGAVAREVAGKSES